MSALSPPIKTLADLLAQLDDIAPDRVRFHPAPGTASKEDVGEKENVLCELVKGVLVGESRGLQRIQFGRS